MPLYTRHREDDLIIGIWNICETTDTLCALFENPGWYKDMVTSQFRNGKRQKERLAVRALCKELTGTEISIGYHPSGRPFVTDGSLQLSISHTEGYAAVIFSERHEVGIDIEHITNKVDKLATRFMNEDEKAGNTVERLLHWSAKETAFKILDKEGIDFCRDFKVTGFTQYDGQSDVDRTVGDLTLHYHLEDGTNGWLQMKYYVEKDFVLTYGAK